MGLFDTVVVDVLAAVFQTKQLGLGMLSYRLGNDGRLVAPAGAEVAYDGLVHLYGNDGAEFMAIFTHGRLESLDPITDEAATGYRCLGEGMLWTRDTW
ncbi:MAG TPA: hypothetical protein VMW75_01335 [Thermoanaerobaculia bacterium]|nr:hypothetical protein [Thermoanaerobaculia bacterium]